MVGASGMIAIGFFFADSNLRKLWFLFFPLVVFVGLYYFIYQLRTVHAQDSPAKHMARGSKPKDYDPFFASPCQSNS